MPGGGAYQVPSLLKKLQEFKVAEGREVNSSVVSVAFAKIISSTHESRKGFVGKGKGSVGRK